jgi:hypothetical protein
MYQHNCAECGKPFTSKSDRARFHNGTCKSAYHYRRRKLARIGDNIQDGITQIAVASAGNPDVMVLESAMTAITAIKETLSMYEQVLAGKLKEVRKASRMKHKAK